MGSVYEILSILSSLLQSFEIAGAVILFSLVQLLEKLIVLTFWWPSTDTDRVDAVNYVHRQNEGKCYSDMFDIASRFVAQ